MNGDKGDDDEKNSRPLPLQDLRKWISSEKTYAWIEEDDRKQAEFQKELEAEGTATNMFDDEDDSDDENEFPRVQEWTSSPTNPDGIGGYHPNKCTIDGEKEEDDAAAAAAAAAITIVFILSESYDGFGDTLWASARHIANQLAEPTKCRELLSPLLSSENDDHRHPLWGKSFVELGAGAGVPSWAAMRCGARVVCTDLASANRIRCIAECIERNVQKIKKDEEEEENNNSNGRKLLQYAEQARACPHEWGTLVDEVVESLNHPSSVDNDERCWFDVLVAADCCYMPWCHAELLDSIHALLHPEKGVALIPFALHGNTEDDDVWGIVEMAKEKGFEVEQLPTQQLTPPGKAMEAKQGLVHTLRLTKR